jgi:hypothetical protein
MIQIKKFITEEEILYYKNMSNNEIKEMIKNYSKIGKKVDSGETDIRNIFGIPDGNIDVLLDEFRKEKFTDYSRKNEWNYGWVNVLNCDGNVNTLKTREANFRYINKWNQESNIVKYLIIIDNDNKILWIGVCKENQYFISHFDKIYEFGYEHKNIKIFPNITIENEYINEDNNEHNDNIIKKYKNNIETYTFTNFDNAKKIFDEGKTGAYISLDEHFPKGFFYKGIKWNANWGKYYGNNYITILIAITVKDNYFYIEIENITYPFYGYLLIDLYDFKIIEAKKCEKTPNIA